jgi:hypothetical protein
MPKEELKEVNEMPQWAKDLIETNKRLNDEVSMLKDFAGKNSIASYEDGKKNFDNKKCHFKRYKDKLIISWDKLDISHYNPRAMDALGENIFIDVTLDDGKKEKINYIDFIRNNDLVYCELIKQGNKFSTVKLPDGQEVEILTTFLNA